MRELADPSPLMARILGGALDIVCHAGGAAIELLDDEGMLSYVATAGGLEPYVGTRIWPQNSLSGLAMRDRRILRSDDTDTDDRVERAATSRLGIRSMVCVPLTYGEDAVGVLKVCAPVPGAFDAGDEATLEEIAGFVGIILQNASDVSRYMSRLAGETNAGVEGSMVSDQRIAIGAFVADVLHPGLVSDLEAAARIEDLVAHSRFAVVFQPIIDLDDGSVRSLEALSRFPGPPDLSPDVWFAEAARVGLGVQLELAAVALALTHFDALQPEVTMAVNASPETVCDPRFTELISAGGPQRLVVELTEHIDVADYEQLRNVLRRLRRAGCRLSVDDTGSGYSSLTRILDLAPDVIKLDLALTHGIDIDPVRRSLASALITFARESGAVIVAEGIETAAEMQTLRELGVQFGQGFLLGRPLPASLVPREPVPVCATKGAGTASVAHHH